MGLVEALYLLLRAFVVGRATLTAENLALRQQFSVIEPRSPWQNPYAERVIGSIRRECLNDVIVFNETHLRRLLQSYFEYCHDWRTHRSLEMDTPVPHPIQRPELGVVRKVTAVGGFHHHYDRRAA